MFGKPITKHVYITNDGRYLSLGPTALADRIPTAAGVAWERECMASEVVYADDELYARHIRAMHNLANHLKNDKNEPYSFEIFDKLPEGWTTALAEHGPCGLRGHKDLTSKYVWCENKNPWKLTAAGYWVKNPGYRMALVRRDK